MTVAIRITGEESRSGNATRLPLVEGMFCNVSIPGRTLKQVFELPHWTVSFEGTVYVAREGRLHTVPVTVAYAADEYVYVSEGLEENDQVVVTRLVNPLENTQLDMQETAPSGETRL